MEQQEANNNTLFPYWSAVWPASIALCNFIEQHQSSFQGKKVLEIAAGLGLPSLVAAQYATSVCSTDYADEALEVIQQSAALNQLKNLTCRNINWHHIPADLNGDIVLLSDVNYNPSDFEAVLQLIWYFLERDTCIFLATPQRLMAKMFIEQVLPFCIRRSDEAITYRGTTTMITTMLLQKS